MSEQKRMLCIDVCCVEKYGSDWPPENVDGFFGWFKSKLSSVPPDLIGEVQINLRSESGYEGDHSPAIEITYSRQETDEEFAIRLAERERVFAAAAPMIEREERRMLAELKAKYEK